ncbi:hypothetical protein Cni_G05329 [Canna indica]|uniref:Uncharacterized protein n=1 Tax=Canna indica TaxID=4628 RepID=A0AAQ3Q5B4_9LILI|nr:hypothetical protein Cni_G05329 [Canna indica]
MRRSTTRLTPPSTWPTTSSVKRMQSREPIIPCTNRFAHDREDTSVLFKVLSAFAFRDISITKIESHLQASLAETRAQNAGIHLLPLCHW